MGSAGERGARFVEGNVSVLADTEYLQINGTQLLEQSVIARRFGPKVGDSTARQVCVFRSQIDLVEKVLPHILAI